MSLRRALAALPDDVESRAAVRGVLGFLEGHVGEPLDAERVRKSTGVSAVQLEAVLKAMQAVEVVDCDGDSRVDSFVYAPDSVLQLEVRRFVRSAGNAEQLLQRGVDRFRGRFGRNT